MCKYVRVCVRALGGGAHADGTIPDGLQMTISLEGDLSDAQKERLLEISGISL